MKKPMKAAGPLIFAAAIAAAVLEPTAMLELSRPRRAAVRSPAFCACCIYGLSLFSRLSS